MLSEKNQMVLNKLYPKFVMAGKAGYEKLIKITENPMEYNEKFLMKLINDNKDTAIGIKYNFKDINSIKDFQEKVPVSEYDDYIDFLIPMVYQGTSNLITSYDVKHYNKSSGTLGNPKKIPISEIAQQANALYSFPMCLYMIEKELGSNWQKGKIFIIGQFEIDTLPSGDTYGALSAKIAVNFKDYFDYVSTSPSEVLLPKENMDSRYLHSLYALMEEDVTVVECAYFSYYLEILRFIEENWESLINDIREGKINQGINISDSVRESLEARLEPNPERANDLEKIFNEGINQDFIKKIWPNIQAFIGIGTSTFSTYVDKIKEKYSGDSVPFLFLGVQASEGIVSSPLELNSTDSVFLPESLFFEFRPIEQEGYNNLLTLDDLEVGCDYEIILTNMSGFYRYLIKDAVRVTGMYNNMPLLTFLYRLNQTINITGEKTTEIALRNSVSKIEDEFNCDCVDFTVYPDLDAVPMAYNFLLELENLDDNVSKEELRKSIEDNLSKANPSFGSKIKDGTFGPLELDFLQSETFMLYRDLMAMKGVSVVQMKPPRIIVNEVQRKFFFTLTE